MALAVRNMTAARLQGVSACRAPVTRRVAVCVRAAAEKPSSTVGKAILVEKIAQEANITKAQATKAFDTLFDSVADALTTGQRVTVVGFGTFETRERKARQGRNPRTGESLSIPASTTPAFRASESFKEKVNGKAAPPKPKAAAPAPAAAPAKPAAPRAAAPRPAAPAPPPAAVKKAAPGAAKPKK